MVSNVTHLCPCHKRSHLASLGGANGPSKHLVFLSCSATSGESSWEFSHSTLRALLSASAKLTESNLDCLVTCLTKVCSIS